ncbi:hypothetical protein W04_1506 [Pseudoalteromonas sp. SW0106-04]|nr:hypothetical protein W04_1506 [Pseudoalteromonas sp. SW0106-04]
MQKQRICYNNCEKSMNNYLTIKYEYGQIALDAKTLIIKSCSLAGRFLEVK